MGYYNVLCEKDLKQLVNFPTQISGVIIDHVIVKEDIVPLSEY